MRTPITVSRAKTLVAMVSVCLILLTIVTVIRKQQKTVTPSYPAMCFVTGTADIAGYAPATWIEREGLKNLVQKFVMFDCLDGKQFVVPWIKQGGQGKKDTH